MLLEIGELQLIAKGLQRPVNALVMGVGLVDQNGVTEPLARLGELQEYLLKSFQHYALLELGFQPAVGIVAGGGTLVDFQRQQIEAQQAGKLGARRVAAAQAGVEGRLGEGQRAHQIDVELGQIVANGLGAVLVRREEAGLFQQVATKGEVALGQLLVQGLVGQQPEPDKRDQPVPEGASAERQRLVEKIRRLGGPQHGVDGDQQRAEADGGIAGTERPHHHEDKGGAGEPDGKQPGGGVEILYAQGREHEADERHGEIFEPSPQAVVGFGNSARHDPEGEQHGELDIAGGQGEGEQTENGQQHFESEVDVTIGQQSAQQAREIHRHETGETLDRNESEIVTRQARSGPDLDQGRFASYP